MRDDLVLKKICKRSKVNVIGSGSGNGVDLNIFTPSETLEKKALLLKRKLGIPENDLIILSVEQQQK